jgi:hypothetical protein
MYFANVENAFVELLRDEFDKLRRYPRYLHALGADSSARAIDCMATEKVMWCARS